MNKLIIILFLLVSNLLVGQNCSTLFSYGAQFETVNFINQSNVSNAHYWWHFGDGTSSHYTNPVHTFPETGTYLVILFAKDTVSNCSSYYEMWLNLNKYSIDSCSTSMTDSIFTFNNSDYIKVIDNSTNCSGYTVNCDAGPAQNFSSNNWIGLNPGWGSARFLSRVQYYSYDSINGYVLRREAYKTSPYKYSSNVNYGDCSANFEFSVISQDTTRKRMFFEAMNKNAIFYEWEIIGFGNPIWSNNDTISKDYFFNSNDLWLVGLKIEGPNGCKDTVYQNILVRDGITTLVSTDELNLIRNNVSIYPNPTSSQFTIEGLTNPCQLSIYNSLGQLLYTENDVSDSTKKIDVSNFKSGLIFIRIEADGEIITRKILKQ